MKLWSVLPPFMSTVAGKFSMAEKIVEYGISVFLFGTMEIMAMEGVVGEAFLAFLLEVEANEVS